MDRKILALDPGFSNASRRRLHRDAARVHLELLDQFISLTKQARNEASSDFLRDSLDDQIDWLSSQKSSYIT